MSKWIKPARVRSAIHSLYTWSSAVKTQNSQHLFPLLALLEKNVGTKEFTLFEESDDFEFWNKYARLPNENRPEKDGAVWASSYYVDPLTRNMRDADHPHRSPSTFRKRTFAKSWQASDYKTDDGKTYWRLAPGFSKIFVTKVLSKRGVSSRVPVVDLSIFLFCTEEFADTAETSELEARFRERFSISDDDYNRIFEYRDEPTEEVFTRDKPDLDKYATEISSALRPPQSQSNKELSIDSIDLGDTTKFASDDPILLEVMEVIALGSSGIIFRGCPGTGKTWYANQIASSLVSDSQLIHRVQFHPSYGYEDFVEGYVPSEDTKSGFKILEKVFVQACRSAATHSSSASPVVLLIDEINRGDPSRIFGEALTYLERGYRGRVFTLPYSRDTLSIPPNLVVLGTMNHFDKSITQLDQAFLRRFDHIDILPSSEQVATFLEDSSGFTTQQIDIVVEWFESLQRLVETGVGHTYFKDVKKSEDLDIIWRYRIRPYCSSLLELEPQSMANIDSMFESMYKRLVSTVPNDELAE